MGQGHVGRTARVWLEWAIVGGLVGALAAAMLGNPTRASADPELDGWAVAAGHGLAVDASGFSLPTAIAVVPSPGPQPDDPAYFVAELRGAIKVVANDRTVTELANVPTVEPAEDDLRGESQSGLAGLCLAPEEGLVFGTFAYPDAGGVLRNDVIRVDTGAGLSAEAIDETRFSEVFADFQSAGAHQIGGCHVEDGRLYIGLGDGGNPAAARDVAALLGKVLCLDLDGGPCEDNPFAGEGGAAAYVLAKGFRNPFGVHVVDGDVFVAENGIGMDRLLRVAVGIDHLWDGTDQSIATGADVVLRPAVSPVQLDHVAAGHEVLGELWGDHFVFSVFHENPWTGVMAVAYDHERARPRGVPRYLVQHVGDNPQHVIAAAVGTDGIYFAGSFPGPDGTSDVLRLRPDPDAPHPTTIEVDWGQPTDERARLLTAHSCVSCHDIGGGAVGGGIAPSLDRFGVRHRLRPRLMSAEYEEHLQAMNEAAGPDEADRVAAREAVLAATDDQERTRVWIEHFLLDPQFDNPAVQMPNPGVTPEEASQLSAVLVPDRGPETIFGRALEFALNNPRAVFLGFLMGTASTFAAGVLLTGVVWLRRRRRRGSAPADPAPAEAP
jgi:hypothetical protein